MTLEETLALVFGVVMLLGVMCNYNLVYAEIHRAAAWGVTNIYNKLFNRSYRRFGWLTYPIVFNLYVWGILGFHDNGFWVTSLLMVIYLFTRIPAWFVLKKRATFVKRRNRLESFGPVPGTLAPVENPPQHIAISSGDQQ